MYDLDVEHNIFPYLAAKILNIELIYIIRQHYDIAEVLLKLALKYKSITSILRDGNPYFICMFC